MPVLLTSGVNYEPAVPIEVTATSEIASNVTLEARSFERDRISTLHLAFDVTGRFGGVPVRLEAGLAGCGSACRSGEIAIVMAGPGTIPVDILRFAKQGEATLNEVMTGFFGSIIRRLNVTPFQKKRLTWLVNMEEGHVLSGGIAFAQDGQRTLSLAGRMIIQVQVDGGTVTTLRSRKEPILEAAITRWPPRGAVLKLSNPPIEYYRSDQLDDPGATPALIVDSNTIEMGQQEVALLRGRPEITNVSLGADLTKTDGLSYRVISLAWRGSELEVPIGEPPVTHYKVHRRVQNDDINGWINIATVSSSVMRYTDTDVPRGLWADYALTQASQYAFGYQYESLVSAPIRVR